MSRFYIRSRLYQLPKNQLQGDVKYWDVIDGHSLIAFDYSGNYIVWNMQSNVVTTRGSVTSCPTHVISLKNGIVAYILMDSVHFMDCHKNTQIRRIGLQTHKYVEKIKRTEDGCIIICANNSNNKRLYIYNGGQTWCKTMDLGNQTQLQTDFLDNHNIVKFQQMKRSSNQEGTFKFSVLDFIEGKEKVFNCGIDLKMTVIQIFQVSQVEYVIFGNRSVQLETWAYIVQIQQEAINVTGPILVSKNQLISVAEFDRDSKQVHVLTSLMSSQLQQACVSDAVAQECIICVECFDLKRKKTLGRLYMPYFEQKRAVQGEHAFVLQHKEVKLAEETPMRVIKLIHQHQLYVHIMKELGVEKKYGTDMLQRVLGFLDHDMLQ